MKIRPFLALTVLCSVPAASPRLGAEDAPAKPDSALPTLAAEFVDADAPEFAEIRQLADRAIERIGYSIVAEVSSNVAKQGPEKALLVCHLKDVPKEGKVIPDMPRIVALKRTSLRLRDPANAPDEADLLALNKVRRSIANGVQPPRLLLQNVELPGGRKEMRAYRPVPVGKNCVACHGPAEDMSVELRDLIKKRYPEDEAIGYALGEWRGLIRVSIGDAPAAAPAPAAKPPVRKG
jgi:hypothetical protein